MAFGRHEPGKGQPLRFSYAQTTIYGLGYKETGDFLDWVPIFEAYDRYVEVWQDSPHPHNFPTLLARQEFGKLFKTMMHGGEPVTRRVKGKRVRGLAGIVGPGGLRTLSPCGFDRIKRT